MTGILLLVAEDEPLLLMEMDAFLRGAGFDTLTVSNGTRALQELNADASRFSGILADIRLGNGPTGWAVSHRARELLPTMPVVYVSGDSKKDWPSQGVPNSIIIEKPFAPAQVITAISQLVNAS
jgi:CheY-like chemotaxis protein